MSSRSRTILALLLVGLPALGCNKAEEASAIQQTSAAPEAADAPPVAEPQPVPAQPQPAPAVPERPEPELVGNVVEIIRKPFGTPSMQLPCNTELFASTTLPAISNDGSKFARLSWVGSSGAAEEEGLVELMVFDAAGITLEQVVLWQPDDMSRAESAQACAALATELERRLAEANAALTKVAWRSLVRLPPLHELTADNVVEVVLIGGPTLAIRQPKVAVYAKHPMPELRVPGRDPEFARECGSSPVLLEAWRDPIRDTLLLEFTGDAYVIDVCDYPPTFEVVTLTFDKPAPSDATWGRAPAWHEQAE